MMFEIEVLKEKKLLELQEIAQKIGVPKFRKLKKLDLIYQILDTQAANPNQLKPKQENETKPKRRRIIKSPQVQAKTEQNQKVENKKSDPVKETDKKSKNISTPAIVKRGKIDSKANTPNKPIKHNKFRIFKRILPNWDHDLHVHSNWSQDNLNGPSMADYIPLAERYKIHIGFADHFEFAFSNTKDPKYKECRLNQKFVDPFA